MNEDLLESSEGVLTDDDVDFLRRLDALYENADKIAIKKLSKNDRSWAWPLPQSHQAGIYVPLSFRGDFFPSDKALSAREDKPHIRQIQIRTLWLGVNEEITFMTYRRFTNKGPEGHLTVPPKKAFASIDPASFLVMARKKDDLGVYFECLTVDSGSSAYGLLERQFDILPAFLDGLFAPPIDDAVPAAIADEVDLLIGEFVAAAHEGKLPELIRQYRQIPDGLAITAQA